MCRFLVEMLGHCKGTLAAALTLRFAKAWWGRNRVRPCRRHPPKPKIARNWLGTPHLAIIRGASAASVLGVSKLPPHGEGVSGGSGFGAMNKTTVELITGLAHALAWPVTVLLVLLLLRGKIGELLLRLRSFQHGETRLNFQDELHAISKASDVPTSLVGGTNVESTKPLNRLRTLAESAPRQAVLGAWEQLMEAAIGFAQEHQIVLSDQELKTPKYLAQRLRDRGLIDAQTSDALVSMRLLRNKVAHAEAMPVATRDALAFIEMVASLTRNLEQGP